MNNPPQLFSAEETKDLSATAIHDVDTLIVKMSKRFARTTVMEGEVTAMMIAYQKGALDMLDPVLKALCKNCLSKSTCFYLDLFEECESYEEIKNVFSK